MRTLQKFQMNSVIGSRLVFGKQRKGRLFLKGRGAFNRGVEVYA